jgi:hypothetical protein
MPNVLIRSAIRILLSTVTVHGGIPVGIALVIRAIVLKYY